MRIIKYCFILILLGAALAGSVSWRAVGINDAQYWDHFRVNSINIYHGAYLHHSEYTPAMEIQMTADWYGNVPNDEPFVFYYEFSLANEAVIVGAKVRVEGTWYTAQAQDVATAENQYQVTPVNQPRCLLRQYVQRDYYGSRSKRYQMQVSPVWYGTPFSISITLLEPNTLELDQERSSIFDLDFLSYRDYIPVSYSFLDVHAPETAPTMENGVSAITFSKNSEGWWQAEWSHQGWYYYDRPVLTWPARKNSTPDIFYYQESGEGYYLLSAFPPVEPQERQAKKVLIIADLGDRTVDYSRDFLLDTFHNITDRSLSWNDSLNILLMDQLEPRLLTPRFLPADYAHMSALFREMRGFEPPQLTATTQLLRRAVEFFNAAATGGEIWLLTTAERDAIPVQKANDIIELTVRQLRQEVAIKIIACGYRDQAEQIGGQYYRGNDYLFENLARLTHGGVLRPENVEGYHLPLALADLISPALDLMEADPFPVNGYNRGKYAFFADRTHYPILYPYIEMGRAQGDSPFAADFYGRSEGEWFHKSLVCAAMPPIKQLPRIKQLWHARHIEEQLQQPQAWNLIDEIGRISKANSLVNAYCALVIPAANGYAAFQRLESSDTLAHVTTTPPLPAAFAVKAWPNPFNMQTRIAVRFQPTANDRRLSIRIYSLPGALVREWDQSAPTGAEQAEVVWDGTNSLQQPVGSGIYFIQVRCGAQMQTLKLTCLK